MRNYLTIGPVSLRISKRHIAAWGYSRIMIGGLSLLARTNDGELMIAAYHPVACNTWHWAIAIGRSGSNRRWVRRDTTRRGQWHDYYRLPFGRELRVSRQDYHLGPSK